MIEVRDEAHWRELRAKNIGGSEVGALFDCSPWMTKYTLWHEKAGTYPRDIPESSKMALGKYLEPWIASELGKSLGWNITASKGYYQHPSVPGMGCTLDFDIHDHEWGPGICETKCVFEYSDYMKDWSDDRAPPNYELQVQHQLAVTGRPWACVAVLVMQTGTIMPAMVRRPNPKVIDEITSRVKAFWDSIEAKVPPDPTGTDEELAIMRHLWPARTPKKVVEFSDNDLSNEAKLYHWAALELSDMEKQRTASKAKLLAAARDAELMRLPGFNVGIKQSKNGAIRMTVVPADNGVGVMI
jgi:putative phage-type endonuclease